jgi:hypothetical protein
MEGAAYIKAKQVGGGDSFNKLLRGSDEVRAWSAQCREQANDGRISGDEREHLLKMSQALLIVADNQDWLDGKKKSSAVVREKTRNAERLYCAAGG